MQNALFREVCSAGAGQSALFREVAVARVRFSVRWSTRMRFFVRRRRVCPGEEKRILRKSAFWGLTSRKDAFCELRNRQNASFGEVRPGGAAKVRLSVRPDVQGALFREVCSAGAGQTALFREAQRAECAFP